MQKHNAKQNKYKGLLCAGLVLLCLCVSGCDAAQVNAGLFSFDIKAVFQALTDHYLGETSTTASDTAPSSSTAQSQQGAIDVVEELTLLPSLGADAAAQSSSIWIDDTNADQGYIMVQYLGSHSGQVKMQLTGPDGTTYTYTLAQGADFAAFPLTGGDGSYTVNIYEQDSGTSYYLVDSYTFAVTLADPLLPYLYPNQFVNYDQTSAALALSIAAARKATSELDLVEQVYYTVMDTLSYDYDLADFIASGGLTSYIPDLDAVIESGQGICFDYAALMVAMLRIQGVPAKLVIGYAGEDYHAWINVYTEESGWVDEVIYFNGSQWALMDPTFADTAGNNNYVGDGETYIEKYVY